MRLKDWWHKNAEKVRDDDLYSAFENCWYAAQRSLLAGLSNTPPEALARYIETAQLEQAIEDGDLETIDTQLRQVEYNHERLQRAKQKLQS